MKSNKGYKVHIRVRCLFAIIFVLEFVDLHHHLEIPIRIFVNTQYKTYNKRRLFAIFARNTFLSRMHSNSVRYIPLVYRILLNIFLFYLLLLTEQLENIFPFLEKSEIYLKHDALIGLKN